MPPKNRSRNVSGAGTIRKKTVHAKNGKDSTYWEGRITVGYDPSTGKQKQRSVTGSTQKEVAQKIREASVEIDNGIYLEPNRVTVKQWLTTWQQTYLNDVKPRTVEVYDSVIRNHLIPGLGGMRLQALNAPIIQEFYNQRAANLSAKSIRNIHCVLHRALQQAVSIGYIRFNPSDSCTLPQIEKREMTPMDNYMITDFLNEIRDTPMEKVMRLALFTGMREGEVLGLQWDCVDFIRGVIIVKRQLQYYRNGVGYKLVTTKNSQVRVITPASDVLKLLHDLRTEQNKARKAAGEAWKDSGFVFTDDLGQHLKTWDLCRAYKRAVTAIGFPNLRFHDLRHTFTVISIRSGDDIKTVQGNLGHATAAFTLDVYGHLTDEMRKDSASGMQRFIDSPADPCP